MDWKEDLARFGTTVATVSALVWGVLPPVLGIIHRVTQCKCGWGLAGRLPGIAESAAIAAIIGLALMVVGLLAQKLWKWVIAGLVLVAAVVWTEWFFTTLSTRTDILVTTFVALLLIVVTNERPLPPAYTTAPALPKLIPLRIPTRSANRRYQALWLWITKPRRWELAEDWSCVVGGQQVTIPKGFTFDGASVPRVFWMLVTPIGILLMPGLIHDYGYKYQKLPLSGGGDIQDSRRLFWDKLFLQTGVDVNGFRVLSSLAGYAVFLFGWTAWLGHRGKRGLNILYGLVTAAIVLALYLNPWLIPYALGALLLYILWFELLIR